jgi:hypothetical protein
MSDDTCASVMTLLCLGLALEWPLRFCDDGRARSR